MSMKYLSLIPHFYIANLGYAGVYLFFLFLLQNIDCGYLLELVPTIYVLNKNKKNIKIFLLKIFNFLSFVKICILHGHVFVMFTELLCSFNPQLAIQHYAMLNLFIKAFT